MSLLAKKITYEAHKRTMRGGVILTMTIIKKNCWISRLRQVAKRVTRKFFACKRIYTKPFTTQKQRIFPTDRTTGARPFQIIGTYFAGPTMYRNKNKREKRYTYFFSHAV